MTHIYELLDRLDTACFYLTLDLAKVWVDSLDSNILRKKMSSSTPFGLNQFVPLPFDFFGAPAMFQHLIDSILHPHNAYGAAYLDDIINCSND